MQGVPVVILSDFASPFCWLAEAALRRLQQEGLVTLEYHALELFPAEVPLPEPPSVDAALPLAAELGLAMAAPTRAVRTRKAHELARMARAYGREDEVREALFAAYLGDDLDIGRIDVLVPVASAAGLDSTEARVVLDVDKHAGAVRHESAQARAVGITAAPVAVLGSGADRLRVEGAFSLREWRGLIAEAKEQPRSKADSRDV